MTLHRITLAAVGLALVACEEKSGNKLTVGAGADAAGGCDLSFEKLGGTEWVFLRANPDKTEVPDSATRLQFFMDGAALKAKYNAGSVADMYTYTCESKGAEFVCREEVKVKDYCQAFLAGGGACDEATLRGFAPDITDEQLQKGIAEGTAMVAQYKDKPEWQSFVLNNNNLGNKLRGVIYTKIDTKKCRLVVQDNYLTIYNAKKVEDSNPAGINPFVKNDQGELLWEHCTDQKSLVALPSADYPADPAQVVTQPRHGAGSAVHFRFLHPDHLKPTEGCTTTFDAWLNGKPLQKGLAVSAVDDGKGGQRQEWTFSHTFDKPSASGAGDVVVSVGTRSCAGKEPEKLVSCAAVLIQ
jgi:hypothetical protein